jgi:hypothetical protein
MAGVLLGPDGLQTEWVLVTPEMAKQWLSQMSENRRLRPNNLKKLKNALLAGRFCASHQGVAFDVNERFTDGQHRLTAIVQTGVSAWLMVTRCTPVKTVPTFDDGVKRQDQDHIKIAGHGDHGASELAAIKVALRGVDAFNVSKNITIPVDVFMECLDLWAAKMRLLQPLRSHKGLGNRVVNGALLRALLSGASEERISEMVSAMTLGRVESDDDIAATGLARAWLNGTLYSGARDLALDAYLKSENAIRNFLQRKRIDKIRRTETEVFQILPEFIPSSYKSFIEAVEG